MRLSIYYNYILFSIAVFIAFSSLSQTYDLTSGSSWSVPANVVKVRVECWGAGGGGSYVTNELGGGGGGGGAYASSELCVTPNSNLSYAIGTGGSGASGINHGGDTWFINTTTVRAQGGRGVADNTAAGGAGGTIAASVGTTRFAGGNGGNGETTLGCLRWSAGGGGGGGATATAGGGNGGNGSVSDGICGYLAYGI